MLQSLDYAHKEVRDYMYLITQELVEDYDYEGLELDWLRCPFCINPPNKPEIKPVTDAAASAPSLINSCTAPVGKLPFGKASSMNPNPRSTVLPGSDDRSPSKGRISLFNRVKISVFCAFMDDS